MRAVVVVVAGLCAAPMAAAQSVVDCEVVDRSAVPADMNQNSRYSVAMRDGRVALVLRRGDGEFSDVIDLVPHRRITGGSFASDLRRSGLGAEMGFWLVTVQDNGVIMFDQHGIREDNGRQTRTRLTVFLRCPAPP